MRVEDFHQFVAWDKGGRCYSYDRTPFLTDFGEWRQQVHNFPLPAERLDGLCPFKNWDERYLDLNVETDRLLFESLVKL